MTFNFCEHNLKEYFGKDTSFFRTGDSIVFKHPAGENWEQLIVVKDAYKPSTGGEWWYHAWIRNDLPPDYKFPDIPDSPSYIQLPGFFAQSPMLPFDKCKTELPVVVAICGMSGSGKTSLAMYLQKEYGIETIVSYTTRAIRPGEEDGTQHWFVSEKDIPAKEDMLAYTYFGGNHYWAAMKDLKKVNTYTIDEQGILDLYELAVDGKIRLLWVQIERPNNPTDSERMKRDSCRQDAIKKLRKIGLEPDINIINDYGSEKDFVENEGSELASYLKHYFK